MGTMLRSIVVAGFVAGALSVLVFHQGLIFLLHAAGLVPFPAWSLAPAPPFGVPQLLSFMFWGGLWGIVWAWIASRLRSGGSYGFAFLFGAILPPLVVIAVVVPLKGGDPRAMLQPMMLVGLVFIHGIFGLGIEVFRRLGRGRLW